MLNLVEIGTNIRHLRTSLNITQDELATTLLVSRQAISRWEQGLALPTIDNICCLVELFGVNVETLLCLDNPKQLSEDDLFADCSHNYVIGQIVQGKTNINLANCIDQFNLEERMLILKSIKKNRERYLNTDMEALWNMLTGLEKQFFNSKLYKEEIKTNKFRRRI
ncbi:MAG: helix-turn-helix transcriptional regulator [Clostridia bacterium]